IRNAPVSERALESVRNVIVKRVQALHRNKVAMDMARPRIRVGKISERRTHTHGPKPIAKAATHRIIIVNTTGAEGACVRKVMARPVWQTAISPEEISSNGFRPN